jgi:hypothetical protein
VKAKHSHLVLGNRNRKAVCAGCALIDSLGNECDEKPFQLLRKMKAGALRLRGSFSLSEGSPSLGLLVAIAKGVFGAGKIGDQPKSPLEKARE